jgi:catechol 2,3-dioxygenase-like lactoylglutathione lyase family enzyme
MGVSVLREVMVGVDDLPARTAQFESGCGLTTIVSGPLTTITVNRLLETQGVHRAAILGRRDSPESPRLRLVEAHGLPPARPRGIGDAGPLGVGFETRGIEKVRARLERSSVRFVSRPLALPFPTLIGSGDPERASTLETFGQSSDGDFIALFQEEDAGPAAVDISQGDGAGPFHAMFVVTNVESSLHFMTDVLQHEGKLGGRGHGSPFRELFGLPADVSIRVASSSHASSSDGRVAFIEFEKRAQPMAHTPGLCRGLCRLRYDTTDIHATLARVPGGGGSLVRGPASVEDPVLGQGLVAMIRAPFGIVLELWERR